MGKMICIEGIDCSGKTSIAKILGEKLNYKFVEKPMLKYFDIDRITYTEIKTKMKKGIIEDFPEDSQDIMFWYQAFNNIIASKFQKYYDIVVDRHYITNAFWNCNDNGNLRNNIDILDSVMNIFGKPDLTVILCVSKETALNRLQERVKYKFGSITEGYGKKDYEREFQKVIHADEFVPYAKKVCENFNMNYLIVDTEGLTSDEVSEIILNHMRSNNLV